MAVLPVVFFHAGFNPFSGGYVGVDVFFVISGYLITSILIDDLENNHFSILKFYERRARRILPALFAVVACCLPMALWLMWPGQLINFAQSVIAVSVFSSNFLFWRESGYFDTAAEEKPLLHTWSLAVEEQYYLVFPIMLALVWPLGRRYVVGTIGVLALASLLLAEWGWRNAPSANFYLAPSRIWELFAGSLVALYLRDRLPKGNQVLSLAGIFLVLLAVFTFDDKTPFPSLWSLIPVAGTALIILSATSDTLVGKVLSTKLLVGIGLISYSTYLWHQPMFAFIRIAGHEEPGKPLLLLLSVLALGIGWISWRWVEQPFRNRNFLSRRGVFNGAILGSCVLIAVGLAALSRDGFIERFDAEDQDIAVSVHEHTRHVIDLHAQYAARESFQGNSGTKVLLTGDSFSQDFLNILEEANELQEIDLRALYVPHACQQHYFGLENTDGIAVQNRCEKFQGRIADLPDTEANAIFIAFQWKEDALRELRKQLDTWAETGSDNFQVVVVGGKDFGKVNRRSLLDLTLEERAAMRREIDPVSASLNSIAAKLFEDYTYLDIHSVICRSPASRKCRQFDPTGHLLSYDGEHLTDAGAEFIASDLDDALRKILY